MNKTQVADIYQQLEQHALVELPVNYELSTYSDHNQWLIQVLAPNITPQQFKQVWHCLHDLKLIVHQLRRITRPVTSFNNSQCLVFYGLNQSTSLRLARQTLKALGQTLNLDINLQTKTHWQTDKRLALFDMDSTLIQAEVIDELAKVAGVGAQVADITAATMEGTLDFQQSFTQRMALLKGLDSNILKDIGSQLVLTIGGENLLHNLHQKGMKTAIVSGGFEFFAHLIQDRLKIDYVFANRLEIIDGKLTGQVSGPIVDAERKVYLLKLLAKKHNLTLSQTLAVGDGANDIPMLAKAGLGVAFCAKPKVQQSADNSINTLGLDGVLYLLKNF